MPDIPFFDQKDSERIAANTVWGEQQRQKGGSKHANEHVQIRQTIYAQLTEKDPEGKIGYWKAEEAYYEDEAWILPDGGDQWDDQERDYVRHFSWGDAELNQIVKLMLVINTDSGLEEWVFDTDVSNPEAFVFYSDQNGNSGQARSDSTWTMKTAGKVLTNVGEATINAPFTLQPGQSAQVVITFTDYGNGFVLSSAQLTTGEGQYWTSGSDGSIVVQHRLAKVEIDGDMTRLIQYHAGDIHIEIFGAADEDDDDPDYPESPLKIIGDEDWISVSRLGNLWTVNHKPPPGAAHALASMKGLDTTFSCDSVTFSSVQDVEDWVNNDFLAKIREAFWDTRGHIYDLKDCAGASVTPTEDPTYTYLTSELISDYYSGTDFAPEAINGTGLGFQYYIKNNGANYLDYINSKKIIVGVVMANGNPITLNINGDAPVLFNYNTLAENAGGTSGLIREPLVNGQMVFGVERYQFNSTATLNVSVIGIGLLQQAEFNTQICGLTSTINATIIRDYLDPNASAASISFAASVADLGSAVNPSFVDVADNGPYLLEVTFKYADGSPVAVSYAGSAGPFKTGSRFLEMDATSTTGTFETWFNLRDSASEGDTVKMCATLRTWDRLTDANVMDCSYLDINYADECITDESGEAVSDGTDDCITDGNGLPVPALGLATCSYPGLGTITGTQNNSSGFNSGTGDDWAAVKAALDISSTTATSVGLNVGIFNNTPGPTNLQRYYYTVDTSSIVDKIACKITWSSNQTNRQFVVVYTTAAEPVVNNVTYDMPTWDVLGSVINATSSTEAIEFDMDTLPRNAALRIGVMIVNDYENDSTGMTGVYIPTNGFRLGSIQFYKCS